MPLLARIVAGVPAELDAVAFARLGLPRAAREYLGEKIAPITLLVTGADRASLSFLRRCGEDEARRFPAFVPGDDRSRPGAALLLGPKGAFEALLQRAREDGEPLAAWTQALARALEGVELPRSLRLREHTLPLGSRTYLMGVVNVTPDSFSDGGRFETPEAALAHARSLIDAGADLLDIGGESTRPGAESVDEETELRRVLPVVEALSATTKVPLSVDTRKPRVAEEALARGAALINDVSGLKDAPELAECVAKHGAALCVMHMRGTPATMQQAPHYEDVMDEVLHELGESVARAEQAGIEKTSLLVDPGIGFAKTLEHNLFLLRCIGELRLLGCPVLVGSSRKSFLGALTGGKPPAERRWASVGSAAGLAASGHVDVLRVHDVGEVRDAIRVIDAVRTARSGGPRYGAP